MYQRKLPLDLSCGIRITMGIIGAKWKPCLIDAVRERPKRPSELHSRADRGASTCGGPRSVKRTGRTWNSGEESICRNSVAQ